MYQNVQSIGVLNVGKFKYSLNKFETTLKWHKSR